jgi:hypothetical protein
MTGSPNLFALTGEALRLARQVEAIAERMEAGNEPETVAELEEALTAEGDNLQAILDKADGYCWARDGLLARAATRREHAKRLMELAAADERRADTLLATLVRQLLKVAPDQRRWVLNGHIIKSTPSTSTEVEIPAEQLPAEYRRAKFEPDKNKIKADLEAGIDIPGCSLQKKTTWRI